MPKGKPANGDETKIPSTILRSGEHAPGYLAVGTRQGREGVV
ncbi:MAG TPA: hypothetical protein VLA19_06675 [Herpetosiphonaceae bacterium]|nr:hypothetical protein [Herpetosiphonaceae bacterium]